MKQLEKYIKEHKTEFDDHTPDRSIWLSIENELSHSEKPKFIAIKPWMAAAVAAFVLGFGVLIVIPNWITPEIQIFNN